MFLGYMIVLMAVALVFLVLKKRKGKEEVRLPPGPPGWPLMGNLFQLGKRPHESLFRLASSYGPLMTLRLGTKTAIVVSSPAMAKELLKNNDKNFAGRVVIEAARCLSYSEHSMIWCQYGPRWNMLRKVVSTNLMSGKRLEAFRDLRRVHVERMIGNVYGDRGRGVEIGRVVFLTTVNLIGNMMFGKDVLESKCEAGEFKDVIWRMMEIGGTPNIADVFPLLAWLDPQRVRSKMTACMKRIFALFEKLISERLEERKGSNYSGESCKDFLDILLDLKRDEGGDGFHFTIEGIKCLFLDMFQAGTDVIATTIEWAMAELLQNPGALKLVQAELTDAVGLNKRVDESDVENLPYLQAVLKEVFRLHPPAPLLSNRAEASCDVAGFHVPKHSQTIVNVWGIGRDPTVWKEPLRFDHGRFLGSDIDYKGHNLELIPFGAGRRMCPGLPLGNRVVKLILASLLHSFHWEIPVGGQMDMTDKFGLSLQKAVPLKAVPRPRLSVDLY